MTIDFLGGLVLGVAVGLWCLWVALIVMDL